MGVQLVTIPLRGQTEKGKSKNADVLEAKDE